MTIKIQLQEIEFVSAERKKENLITISFPSRRYSRPYFEDRSLTLRPSSLILGV